jgi:hypothetical protein
LHRKVILEATIVVVVRRPLLVCGSQEGKGILISHCLTENVTGDRGFQCVGINVAFTGSFRGVTSMSGSDDIGSNTRVPDHWIERTLFKFFTAPCE